MEPLSGPETRGLGEIAVVRRVLCGLKVGDVPTRLRRRLRGEVAAEHRADLLDER